MNDALLVDTDVASFLFKNSPHAKPFRPLLKGKRLVLAFVSVAELFKWAVKRCGARRRSRSLKPRCTGTSSSERSEEMKKWLVFSHFRHYFQTLYDRDLAWMWAQVVIACDNAGRPIAASDAWIAAAALRHELPLLTNNLRHFETVETLCGLKLLRPQNA
jgi:tRNA(fMet)-specific endonuclease VapC